nr:unnamed protein product [Callosobruchus chinensis]
MIQYFSNFGIPQKITCDNGSEWKNNIFQDLCNILYNIALHYTTAYNPNSNSPVERFHSTIIETIRTLREEKPHQNIRDLMNYAIYHTIIVFTPQLTLPLSKLLKES